MKASWWVLGKPDKSEFVGWSCGSEGPLEDAAIYRSEANAKKKLKELHKFNQGQYVGFVPLQITVTV